MLCWLLTWLAPGSLVCLVFRYRYVIPWPSACLVPDAVSEAASPQMTPPVLIEFYGHSLSSTYAFIFQFVLASLVLKILICLHFHWWLALLSCVRQAWFPPKYLVDPRLLHIFLFFWNLFSIPSPQSATPTLSLTHPETFTFNLCFSEKQPPLE